METVTAPGVLKTAAQHMEARAATYDKPEGERSMGQTVAMFNACTGRDLNESEGWLLLQCLKQVRLFARDGYHADSAEDNVAYAALLAEAKSREVPVELTNVEAQLAENLVSLIHAVKFSSPSTIDEEVALAEITLVKNGYPTP